MNIDQYFIGTNCCGMDQVKSFSGHGIGKKPSLAILKELIEQRALGTAPLYGGPPRNPRGYLLATTNSKEKAYSRDLLRAGFKKLDEFWNPNTQRVVTLWGYKLYPGKEKAN